MSTKVIALVKKPFANSFQAILRQKKESHQPTAKHPAKAALFIQKTLGNRVCRRILNSASLAGVQNVRTGAAILSEPSVLQRQAGPDNQKSFPDKIQRSAVTIYKSFKNKLKRELIAINRIGKASLKKRRQVKFLKKIYNNILLNNPFKLIQVKKLKPSVLAETVWRNRAKKSLGIKVVFSEAIFKQPLEEIIATAIHEATHAHQMKKGINYYPSLKSRVSTKRGAYLRAVQHFAEADANLATLFQFSKALNPKQRGKISYAISLHFLKADKELGTMALSSYYHPIYRRKVTDLFTRSRLKHAKTIIKLWKHNKKRSGYKHVLLPWRKLP